ncbi:hypothetical protein BC829DRAFT_401435, partial [Chytridium lagenaria]
MLSWLTPTIAEHILRIPYISNILILTPVLITLHSTKTPFPSTPSKKPTPGFPSTPYASTRDALGTTHAGYRVLVTSLWSAIHLSSIYGAYAPHAMVPVLVAQVIYKALYLYNAERGRLASWVGIKTAGWKVGGGEAPKELVACFAGIVLVLASVYWVSDLGAKGCYEGSMGL